jgi:hypothetical protein
MAPFGRYEQGDDDELYVCHVCGTEEIDPNVDPSPEPSDEDADSDSEIEVVLKPRKRARVEPTPAAQVLAPPPQVRLAQSVLNSIIY